MLIREAAIQISSLNGRAIKRGGGVEGQPLRCFIWVVTVFSKKNRAILVQKLGTEKKLLKSVSSYFMTKKSSMAIKPEGGGGR